MRPQIGVGDAALPSLSRKSSVANASTNQTPTGVPTTFFFASEDEIMASEEPDKSTVDVGAGEGQTEGNTSADSTYGVQSLDDALVEGLERFRMHGAGPRTPTSAISASEASSSFQVDSPKAESKCTGAADSREDNDRPQPPSHSNSPPRGRSRKVESNFPLSLLQRTATPGSTIPSTPKSVSLKSLQLSDDDDEAASIYDGGSSQAVASSVASGDDDEALPSAAGLDGTASGTTAAGPQFIMPSIKMPSRRPFTDRGRHVGKLKILVAGAEGAGKTSLIRSIIQLCEDIIHVDPRNSMLPSLNDDDGSSSKTKSITEVQASTRAYASWWSDDGASSIKRRKSSINEPVLERNICFLDTPGYSRDDSSQPEEGDAIIQYLETLLRRNAEIWTLSEAELLGVLGGHGGVQVDLILYVLTSHSNLHADVQHMHRLSELTNVIPLIGRSDELSSLEIAKLKNDILCEMKAQDVRPFLFGHSFESVLTNAELKLSQEQENDSSQQPPEDRRLENPLVSLTDLEGHSQNSDSHAPYSVSSLPGRDLENMDASLLMSSDYLQPLLASELSGLVYRIFTPENAAWLRHVALKKFLTWRRSAYGIGALQLHNLNTNAHTTDSLHISRSLSTHRSFSTHPFFSTVNSPSPGSPLSFLSPSSSPPTGSTSHALALATSNTQQEAIPAQIHVASWATDLDRSLRNERARHEAPRRRECEKWLAEQKSLVDRNGRSGGASRLLTGQKENSSNSSETVIRRDGTKKIRRWKIDEQHNMRNRDDPLRLHDLGVVLGVLGGAGVMGAVFWAVVKSWHEGGFEWLGLARERVEPEVFVCF